MNAQDRRDLLRGRPSPDATRDYVVELERGLTYPGKRVDIALRYVPDRAVLRLESLEAYFDALGDSPSRPLEEIGAVVLGDVNDCLVPRWIEVRVATSGGDGGIESHAVLLQDRQPKWDNPALLARLRKY